MSKQKKYHYIYRTTCIITGKFYVGMHSTDILEDGYLGSGKILGYSRKKHGDENHIREILEFMPDRKSLALREEEIVNSELLANPLNINLKYGGAGGGGGGFISEDHSKKFHRSGWLAMMQNKDFSASSKLAWQRHRTKFLKAFKERGVNAALCEAAKSEESIAKRKDTFVKIHHQQKEKNSQFGKVWVNNGKHSKSVKKEDLESYKKLGYILGRSLKTFNLK